MLRAWYVEWEDVNFTCQVTKDQRFKYSEVLVGVKTVGDAQTLRGTGGNPILKRSS